MNTYYAAIFTSQRSEHNSERYESMSENLVELVKTQPGFIRIESARDIVEQDHCFIKKRVRSMLGFKSYETATSILSGVEAMHRLKKGQLHPQVKSAQNEVRFIHKLFGIAS